MLFNSLSGLFLTLSLKGARKEVEMGPYNTVSRMFHNKTPQTQCKSIITGNWKWLKIDIDKGSLIPIPLPFMIGL